MFRVRQSGVSSGRHLIAAVVRAETDQIDEDNAKEELDKGNNLPVTEGSVSERQQKGSQLRKRIVFALGIGISFGGIVLAGGRVFTVA